jgi:hypothetical protein
MVIILPSRIDRSVQHYQYHLNISITIVIPMKLDLYQRKLPQRVVIRTAQMQSVRKSFGGTGKSP